MHRTMFRVTLSAFLFISILMPAAGEDTFSPEHYAATLLILGTPRGTTTINLDFRITKYTPLNEALKLGEVLKEKGQAALVRTLDKSDCGQVSPTGSLGVPIAVAQSYTQEGRRTIRITAVRYMRFLELWYNGRSRDYPFGIFEFTLDSKGVGSGTAILAASVRFSKKHNQYEIESYDRGASVVKLVNVRKLK